MKKLDFLYSKLYKQITPQQAEKINDVHTLLWELLNFHPEARNEVVTCIISLKAKYNQLKKYD